MLLVGIAYAATFGSAHSHGTVSSRRYANGTASATGQAQFSAKLPRHSHAHSHECLLCLLQQHLFNGALYKVPSALAPESTERTLTPSPAAPYISVANTPRRGRAPPSASLL